VAYINHDIDDAVRADVLREEEIPPPIRAALGDTKSARIHTLVRSVVLSSGESIRFDPATEAAFEFLHSFMFEQVYTNPACKSEERKAIDMIIWLFEHFSRCPDKLPEDYRRIVDDEGPERAAVDYIAGMTDRFAVHCFEECFVPRAWTKY